jgi:hypothetical protein
VDPAQRPATCQNFLEALSGRAGKAGAKGGSAADSGSAKLPARPRQATKDRRRSARHPCLLDASCWVIGGDSRKEWQAKLKDISRNGICFFLTRRCEPGTVLVVELRSSERKVLSRLLMKVLHAEPHAWAKGWWSIGGTLACKIGQDELRHFQAAALDARGVEALLRLGALTAVEATS